MDRDSQAELLWKRFDRSIEDAYCHLKAIMRQPDYDIKYSRHFKNMFADLCRAIDQYFDEAEGIEDK
jgi:hypothetical protein